MNATVQRISAGLLLACGWLAGAAHAQEVRRWNPYYRDAATQRATVTDHETAALRQANLRRSQIGLPAVTENAQIAVAAAGHSAYLAMNNLTGHYQSASQYPQGFTGVSAGDRLTAAGYSWRGYGEVISFGPATGALGVENLVEAIYHRFGLFSPAMDEAGAGFVDNHPAYGNVLTINLGNQQTPAVGSPAGWVGMYPYVGQTGVQIDFYSDQESPDPVPGANRVGYPVSFHVGHDRTLTVDAFTLATASGTNVPVTLLSAVADEHVPVSAAAIIPQSPLSAGTTYRASFSGRADGVSVSQSWQFTTAAPASVIFSPANPCISVGTTRNVFIVGGSATNVNWSNAQVINVAFVSSDQLAITALAAGTASVTVTVSGNGTASTTVTVGEGCTVSADSSSDRIFDWAEARYRHLFEAPGAASQTLAGYYYRYYPVTQTYLGTKDGDIWYLDGYTGMMFNVGRIEAFLPAAAADGY